MIMFAIRHKPAGLYLPPSQGPKTWSVADAEYPRLHTKFSAAKHALQWWLKGRVEVDTEGDGDLLTIPVRTRRAQDMEIVEFELVERRTFP